MALTRRIAPMIPLVLTVSWRQPAARLGRMYVTHIVLFCFVLRRKLTQAAAPPVVVGACSSAAARDPKSRPTTASEIEAKQLRASCWLLAWAICRPDDIGI